MVDIVGHFAYLLCVAGTLLIAKKKLSGWVLCLIGTQIWFVLGLILGLSSIWFWELMFGASYVWGIWKWRKANEDKQLQSQGAGLTKTYISDYRGKLQPIRCGRCGLTADGEPRCRCDAEPLGPGSIPNLRGEQEHTNEAGSRRAKASRVQHVSGHCSRCSMEAAREAKVGHDGNDEANSGDRSDQEGA